MRIFIVFLSLTVAQAATARLSIDTFVTPATAVTEDQAGGFDTAPETITGNRLFGIDEPGTTGTIGGGRLTCTMNAPEDGCIVFYNFIDPYDLTQGGTLDTVIVDVESVSGGPVLFNFSIASENDGIAGTTTVFDLQPGENALPLSSLIPVTANFDVTAAEGLVLAILNDSSSGATLVLREIYLSGNGSFIQVNAASSSTFFDPNRDGEGIQFVVLPDNETIVLTWYTYVNGQQLWLIGSGPLVNGAGQLELIATSGAQFGSGFRPADVLREVWGTMEFRLLDCNRIVATAIPQAAGFAPVAIAMTRVLGTDCVDLDPATTPAGGALGFEYSGTYFDPARDGEGFQIAIEEDGRTVVATWYTYLDGQPIWLIGVGAANGSTVTLDMTITSGAQYGEAFDPADVVRTSWGTVRLNWSDCNNVEAQISPTVAGFEAFTLFLEKIGAAQCR